ncbi:hypothetical protein [Mucilaginibacter myungsuensis]|uniref:Uncharacterized protein n=1 Tax=Mucilaginibacter myungsuensis TaxID=649104 RepID=A0A929KYA1_9SPHI|nr:hypothetical protein [Mucilaginibacter myungsuensis]MBE9663894.1 hypothetical protein [Mucilaginibacter myungsuensis]MDN3598390.1 hypothetical protein [Mucilaginibacter myungsuensis]
MTAFYKKLNRFGRLVHQRSRDKQVDIANYFTVTHPGHPVVKNTDDAQPSLQFEDKCPRSVRKEVAELWKTVFGG